uniref:Uncharacterized protein n=1 Tax=Myoviridae sp. ctJ2i1 TaxID=2825079 RepID=A0A8S5V1G3_9CAUD|nr:MAG TPA: hypothetical protein [Myoviridae sp. ctJ2i1]
MRINKKEQQVKSLGIESGLYHIQNEVAAAALEQLKATVNEYGIQLKKENSEAKGLTGYVNELIEDIRKSSNQNVKGELMSSPMGKISSYVRNMLIWGLNINTDETNVYEEARKQGFIYGSVCLKKDLVYYAWEHADEEKQMESLRVVEVTPRFKGAVDAYKPATGLTEEEGEYVFFNKGLSSDEYLFCDPTVNGSYELFVRENGSLYIIVTPLDGMELDRPKKQLLVKSNDFVNAASKVAVAQGFRKELNEGEVLRYDEFVLMEGSVAKSIKARGLDGKAPSDGIYVKSLKGSGYTQLCGVSIIKEIRDMIINHYGSVKVKVSIDNMCFNQFEKGGKEIKSVAMMLTVLD